ncbi:TPA: hypothetical protein ACTYQ8_000656 [Citrobacter amalonaticus]|uniref:hypothetical protein n=1 Tax=unclassified Citrobacter TaxID=2644389 RepID=UPI0006BA44DB|nr:MULTISPECIES: hypothetical protein [unclassified Citrobacter]MDM3524768.1 hypothetical protein [Citrobacter sp. Ca226]HEM7434594.1 hypothetical protein [Citrobacter amalonaticus]
MKFLSPLLLVVTCSVFADSNSDVIDFKRMTESTCFNPANHEAQELCEKSIKIMLLNATSIGYSEASCFVKALKDKGECKKTNEEYMKLMRYSFTYK